MAKIERTKNASRNIVFGVVLKVYQLAIPFLMRTAMIYVMGVQYLGLNSLFASVLQVLNLAELGVGSAMVFSMYKPIAEDDRTKICALMKLYKLYYRIIGIVIMALGLVLLPFIPKLIKGDVPSDVNVYILYLINLLATVLSYWLFAYKNSILQAHQRVDIVSKVSFISSTVQYALQLLVLFAFKNYYLYILVMLFTQVMTNITTAIVADRMYPQYKPEGALDKSEIEVINARIKDLFTAKLGAIIVNSADTIVISAFLGLTMLAVYQNYFFILSSVIAIITILYNSIRAGIGNSLIVESKQKNFNDLNTLTFLICWIAGMCSSCFICLYQPFMKIWVGEKLMLDFWAVIFLTVYFYIYEVNQLLNLYKDAGGIWHEDRFRPLVTALTNLAMNIIMVNFWGIYGVMLSTVISMVLVGMPWLLHNLFTMLFEKEGLPILLRKIVLYMVIGFVACVISYNLAEFITIPGFIGLILKGIIAVVIPNVIFIVCYFKQQEFKRMLELLNKMLPFKLFKNV